jgi:CheY-like chemotaxis protein
MLHILLVEDDEVEAEALIRAFRRQDFPHPVLVAADGVEALYLLRGGASGGNGQPPLPRPCIVLLDLNMPRMSGVEFLAALRQDQSLKRTIVFVLTTSNRAEDKAAAYNHQIAGYLLKANQGEEFAHLVAMLTNYWRVVEFPPDDHP